MSDIRVKNFTCSYEQKTIFDNFDVTFEQGKINVILGGSGVGKTTLLNAIAGIKSYEGQIEGCEGGVSYIFQKDRLIPSISVYKNLDLILKGVVKDKAERKRMIEQTAVDLEISDVLKSLPSERRAGAKGEYGTSVFVSVRRHAIGRTVQGTRHRAENKAYKAICGIARKEK